MPLCKVYTSNSNVILWNLMSNGKPGFLTVLQCALDSHERVEKRSELFSPICFSISTAQWISLPLYGLCILIKLYSSDEEGH